MDNRRNTIVIDKSFQYQYSLMIAALAVLLVNGFIVIRLVFPGDQPLTLTPSMSLGLAAVELILIVGIWYGSLKISHRIAGPVYVFSREISKLGTGDLTASISLRDKDMFHSQAAEMNQSIAALRKKISNIKDLSEKLLKAHTAGDDISAFAQQLSTELSSFTDATER